MYEEKGYRLTTQPLWHASEATSETVKTHEPPSPPHPPPLGFRLVGWLVISPEGQLVGTSGDAV